jgi:hypothetical protein
VSFLSASSPDYGEQSTPAQHRDSTVAELASIPESQSLSQEQHGPPREPESSPALEYPEPSQDTIGSDHHDTPPSTAKPQATWAGPVIVLISAGVLGQAWLGYEGRTTGSFSALLWYLMLCLIFTPAAALLMSKQLSDQAKIWFSLYMALALLATRFVLYPNQFAYHDELINYRVLLSIIQSRHLFTPNPLLPDTADYPGMEIATAAVHQLTGLPLHAAGMAILALVRVVITLALIRIIERVSGSVTAGCLAALIYATNPQYIFFNSQYSYQSVALPLCFFCIYVFTLNRQPRNLLAIAPSAAVAVAVAATHHLTAAALVIVLWVWYLFSRILKRPVNQLLPLAVATLLIVAAWTWLSRAVIVPYILEIARNSLDNVASLLNGQGNHKFFTDSAGDRNPFWQDIISIASVLLITATLIPALCLALIKHRLLTAAGLALFATAALYPIIPGGHLTNATSEISDRSSGFVFVGLGYIVAAWWFRAEPFHRHSKPSRFTIPRNRTLLVLGLTLCFVGGAVLSGPDWIYGPGRYLVSADNRSVDQLALQAASWEQQNLPAQSLVYSDRVNGLLAGVYGDLHLLTPLSSGIDQGALSTLLLAGPSGRDVDVACGNRAQNRVQFLIADARLATSLPHLGVYIDNGEDLFGFRKSPPPPDALTKFDNVAGAQRIFDDGDIRIYDLRGLSCPG